MFTKALSGSVALSLTSHSKPSRTLVLASIILALSATTADARRGGRHHGHGFSRHFILPIDPRVESYARGSAESYARGSFGRRQFDRRSVEGNRFEDNRGESNRFDRPRVDRRDAERGDLLALVPPNWREQPPDPNVQGRRYVSPEGDAWVAFYASPAEGESRKQHLKAVAFVDGEELTYLQRERDWLAVSGFKGEKDERIFYRKVVLACGQHQWRHIAFEYPAEAKRAFDSLVTSMSKALDRSVGAYCEDATVSRTLREPR
jgi:hypothetical protein